MMQLPNFKALLGLSFGFFTTLFSFFSAANVFSKLMKERGYGNLGFYGLAVLYVALSLSSFAAPSVAGSMKTQRVLQIGCFSFTLWVLSGLVATLEGVSEGLATVSVVAGSICNGVGGSIIWVAQGKYLANCVKKCE